MNVTEMSIQRSEFTKRSENVQTNFGALTLQTTGEYRTHVRPEEPGCSELHRGSYV